MTVQELIDALQKVKKQNRSATVHVMTSGSTEGQIHGDVAKVDIVGQHTTIVMDLWSLTLKP